MLEFIAGCSGKWLSLPLKNNDSDIGHNPNLLQQKYWFHNLVHTLERLLQSSLD